MGGERETTLDEGKSPVSRTGEETTIVQEGGRTIRTHESGGQVHFHDDARKLKVAVPSVKWWKAWDVLEAVLPDDPKRFSFIDTKEQTLLLIGVVCEPIQANDGFEVKTSIEVFPCKTDKNFSGLANFTRGGTRPK